MTNTYDEIVKAMANITFEPNCVLTTVENAKMMQEKYGSVFYLKINGEWIEQKPVAKPQDSVL